MPTFLAEILGQLRAIWARLDVGQRTVVVAVLLGTVAGLGAVVWFAGQPDFVVVYSSNDQRELARAATAVEGAGLAYKRSGNSLAVDSSEQQTARSALGGAGIAAQGGAEDLGGLLSDRETRKLGLDRLVRADAEAKLESMRGVLEARVSHSKPKPSPFRSEDSLTQPRAHVMLRLERGAEFGPIARSAAIQAAAALGMPQHYVTVTNAVTHATYTPPDPDSGAGLDTSEFLGQQRRRAEELTDRAQALLDRVYPEKAMVTVAVELDPQWVMTKERGAPTTPMVTRTRTSKEESNEPSRGADAVGTAAGGAATAATQSTNTKETEYSEAAFKETSTGMLAPAIRKLSVALVVDSDALGSVDRQQLVDAVKGAVGWRSDRDDEVSVLEAPFPEVVLAEPAGSDGMMPMLERILPSIAQMFGVVVVVLFLRRLMKRSSVPTVAVAGAPAGGTSEEAPPELSTEEATLRVRREIERTIGEDPATVSRLLESWLTEQKT
ncbi:MAG: flagellar M-ring protein FliF C-terminal domain-containing protein [Planctomycetota bacterium]